MSCDNLVCASCSGLVEQGRCPVCRASREHLHAYRALPAGPVLTLAAALLLLLLVVSL